MIKTWLSTFILTVLTFFHTGAPTPPPEAPEASLVFEGESLDSSRAPASVSDQDPSKKCSALSLNELRRLKREGGRCLSSPCGEFKTVEARNYAMNLGFCKPDGATAADPLPLPLPRPPGTPVRIQDDATANPETVSERSRRKNPRIAPAPATEQGQQKPVTRMQGKPRTHRMPLKVDTSTPITIQNCMKKYEPQLGELACVACGLQFSKHSNIGSQESVANWISLLGAVSQEFQGIGPGNRKAYQRRVIEMVSTYGFCTDSEYPNGASSHVVLNASPRERGQFNRTVGNRPTHTDISKEDFQNIFRGFNLHIASVPEVAFAFREYGSKERFVDRAFGKCMIAIKNRAQTNPAFKFRQCPDPRAKDKTPAPAIGTTAGETAELEPEANAGLYKNLAQACSVPLAREAQWDCKGLCYGQNGAPRICGSDRSYPGRPDDGDGGGGKNPGKGSEPPSKDRDHGKRGERPSRGRDTSDRTASPDGAQ